MATFLIDGHPSLDRVEAETWAEAEAMIAGKGEVLGELVPDDECKRASTAGVALTELKFAAEDGQMTFSGYGSVFNNVDLGGDKIAPGAFAETLAQHKANGTLPAMYLEHGRAGGGPVLPVGKWLAMSEDQHGLKVEGQIADTSMGQDAYKLLKMGALTGLSIGYRVREAARPAAHEDARRVIKAATLVEVSLVANPMNPAARVQAVKSADEITTIRDLEHALRDAGHSKADAVRICARFQAKSAQGEPDKEAAAIAALLRRNLLILSK